jgi:hypothetical protein
MSVIIAPHQFQNILRGSAKCKKTLLKSNGDYILANSNSGLLNSFLVELQSSVFDAKSNINSLKLPHENKVFIFKNLINNILLISEINSTNYPVLTSFWEFNKSLFLLLAVLGLWLAILLTRAISIKLEFLLTKSEFLVKLLSMKYFNSLNIKEGILWCLFFLLTFFVGYCTATVRGRT